MIGLDVNMFTALTVFHQWIKNRWRDRKKTGGKSIPTERHKFLEIVHHVGVTVTVTPALVSLLEGRIGDGAGISQDDTTTTDHVTVTDPAAQGRWVDWKQSLSSKLKQLNKNRTTNRQLLTNTQSRKPPQTESCLFSLQWRQCWNHGPRIFVLLCRCQLIKPPIYFLSPQRPSPAPWCSIASTWSSQPPWNTAPLSWWRRPSAQHGAIASAPAGPMAIRGWGAGRAWPVGPNASWQGWSLVRTVGTVTGDVTERWAATVAARSSVKSRALATTSVHCDTLADRPGNTKQTHFHRRTHKVNGIRWITWGENKRQIKRHDSGEKRCRKRHHFKIMADESGRENDNNKPNILPGNGNKKRLLRGMDEMG